jgi:PPOX class probable F420-dependent enzyme
MAAQAPLHLPDKVTARLADERIVWLTTVDKKGRPVPTPVWFLWTESGFLVFSEPRTPKLANIAANPQVSLHFNADRHGGSVAVFTGSARVEADVSSEEWERYVRKYEKDMGSLDFTPERFRATYSEPVRIAPERLRSW